MDSHVLTLTELQALLATLSPDDARYLALVQDYRQRVLQSLELGDTRILYSFCDDDESVPA